MWYSGTHEPARPSRADGGAARSAKYARRGAPGRLDQPLARVAAAQRPVDLVLELVERLDRVPARRPVARDRAARAAAPW